jgi:hypothetical protein
MTLPSGQIALSEVNTELGISPAWTRIEMQNDRLRALAGGASATYWNQIAMSDLRGKSVYVPPPYVPPTNDPRPPKDGDVPR